MRVVGTEVVPQLMGKDDDVPYHGLGSVDVVFSDDSSTDTKSELIVTEDG